MTTPRPCRHLAIWLSLVASGTSLLALAATVRAEVAPPTTPTSLQPIPAPVVPALSPAVVDPVPQDAPESQPTSASTATGSPLQPGEVRILAPRSDLLLEIPAVTVMLQFEIGTDVELRVNGVTVNPAQIGRTETNRATNQVTQTWYGVTLQDGDNRIEAIARSHPERSPASVTVQVRGAIQTLQLRTAETRILADQRSTATIQGELLDARGNRSNRDAVLTLSSSAGEFLGADANLDQPGFQVQARQGQFTAQLRSSLQAQTVRIRATTGTLEALTQLEFETYLRPSLVAGVIDLRLGAAGTDFYGSFRDFLNPSVLQTGTRFDLNAQVFATGRIGEWLLTAAYNNRRPLNKTCDRANRLYQDLQPCDQQYPVYGDSSTRQSTAPSQDSLFLRLERNQDYVQWGDYNTQELATASQQFTALTRQLHGFKLNYNLGDLQVTGFYGDNVQGFQRDTIAPDGTSGLYFLSRRLLVAGSENVFIETEELNRPGTVLTRTALSRTTDYEIDYDRGSLLFRQPLLRTDIDPKTGAVLVRRLVVTYQFENRGETANIYGGRLRYHFARGLNQESWLGTTYVVENQGSRRFQLYGADLLVSLGGSGQLIAEYANSQNDFNLVGSVQGAAYRIEAKGSLFPGVEGRAYLRSADAGFANNATTSFVPGQTRYGAEVTAKVAEATTLQLQYDREENFGIAPRPLTSLTDLLTPGLQATPGSRVDNSLTTITAGLQQQFGSAKLQVDWVNRDRQDRLAAVPFNGSSSQLRSRLTVPLDQNLALRLQNDQNLSSGEDPLYPNRTAVGLDWAVHPGVTVSLNQQFFTSGQFQGTSITSLDTVGTYALGSDTDLTARYSLISGINGLTSQGALGFKQRWAISPGLRLSLAYERIFGGLLSQTAAGPQFLQPFAVGQSASSLGVQPGDSYGIGLDYTDSPTFKASARFEQRTSSAGVNTVITAGATGKLSPALTALVNYQQASAANQGLQGFGDSATLRVGLAYRDPNNDSFNALLRYEYRQNPATIPNSILFSSGTGTTDQTVALEAIYAPNWQWEFYGKFALRNSTSYLAQDLVGTSSISLAQLRATYRLGYNMDLVGEARWIGQPVTGYSETGFVVEAGYYLTPNLRASVGYSFGSVADRDFSGNRAAGGLYVGLTLKLNELFDGFGLQRVAPPQQQEAQVSVAQPLSPVSPPATPPSGGQP